VVGLIAEEAIKAGANRVEGARTDISARVRQKKRREFWRHLIGSSQAPVRRESDRCATAFLFEPHPVSFLWLSRQQYMNTYFTRMPSYQRGRLASCNVSAAASGPHGSDGPSTGQRSLDRRLQRLHLQRRLFGFAAKLFLRCTQALTTCCGRTTSLSSNRLLYAGTSSA